MFEQMTKLDHSLYLESFLPGFWKLQYAGIDAEAAISVLDGRIFLGVSGSAVKKSDPDNTIKA